MFSKEWWANDRKHTFICPPPKKNKEYKVSCHTVAEEGVIAVE